MLNSPEKQINSWKDIEAKIEDSRQLLTHTEQEVLRLKKEATSVQYTIDQLHLQKAELDSFILDRTARKENLSIEVDDLSNKVATLNEDITKQSVELMFIQGEVVSTSDSQKKANDALKKREEVVSAREKQVADKELSLDTSTKELVDKHNKVKKFANSL